jgi:hypothetical protein
MEEESIMKKGLARLTSKNYRTWAALAQAVIESKDAWEAIEPYGPKDEASVKDTGDGIASIGAVKLDRVRDAKARTVILGNCGPEATLRILHLRTAKEQWEELRRAYLPMGRQQLSAAFQRFHKPTIKEGSTVNDIVTELRMARMDIYNIDPLQMPTDEAAIAVLFSALLLLNPTYGPIILQIELQGTKGLGAVISHLEEAERRLNALTPKVETALLSREKGGKGKSKGKGNSNNKGNNGGLQCWYCEAKGHVKVKCYKWLKDTDEGRKYAEKHPEAAKERSSSSLPTPGTKGALTPEKAQAVVEPADEVCWEAGVPRQACTDWILDSGCTRHMTSNREAFTDYSTVQRTVEVANGSVLLGIGLGSIRLAVSVEGHVRSIVLTDVLHVPQIKGNLISVARLQDKGIVVETTAPPAVRAMVIKHQGRTIGMATRVGNAFILDVPTDRAYPTNEHAAPATAPTDRTELEYTRWHCRFGHIGPQIISKLHTVVGGMSEPVRPGKSQPACEICSLTKKVRVINRIAPERSTQPLARVFSDYWGPYRVPTIEGDIYMLTFTDDYTRKSWVVLTKDRRTSLPFEYGR